MSKLRAVSNVLVGDRLDLIPQIEQKYFEYNTIKIEDVDNPVENTYNDFEQFMVGDMRLKLKHRKPKDISEKDKDERRVRAEVLKATRQKRWRAGNSLSARHHLI